MELLETAGEAVLLPLPALYLNWPKAVRKLQVYWSSRKCIARRCRAGSSAGDAEILSRRREGTTSLGQRTAG